MSTSAGKALDYTMIILAVIFGGGSIALLFGAGTAWYSFGWSEGALLLWDGFLSFFFFGQHSGMVRDGFRKRLSAFVSPSYLGAVYSIASGVALILVVALWQRSSIMLYRADGLLYWILRLVAAAAVAFFILSLLSFKSFDMLGLRPIRYHLRGVVPRPAPFVVRGAYRWVRHPFYACILVLFWTEPVITADELLFNVLWSGWIYVGSIFEERDLVREFGDAYLDYQKRVPRFFPWRRPA